MSVVCKVAYKHYCLCYAVWQNQTLSLEIVVAQTGQKYVINITLLNLVEILENDHELYFKAVTFDQLFTRICKHWIDFKYQLDNVAVKTLQKAYESSKLLFYKKCMHIRHSYPLSQLKANGDIETGFSDDELATIFGKLRPLPYMKRIMDIDGITIQG